MSRKRYPEEFKVEAVKQVVGRSMHSRITKELALDALLMAVWQRKPKTQVLVHSDQGSQYTSHDWQLFLKQHGLEGSMSRRGNCHDNAVAESFFQLLKRERIKRQVYPPRKCEGRCVQLHRDVLQQQTPARFQ